jgi:hypothetical protein
MSKYESANRTQTKSDDLLPVEAASEIDALEALIGTPLKEGHNHISRNKSGLELMVRAKEGSALEYVILDAQGNPVDQVVHITARNKATKKTTCWECGVDADGNRHCWKVPCPDIVGPWEPGKVIAQGYLLL